MSELRSSERLQLLNLTNTSHYALQFRVSPTELAMFGIQYRGFHVEDLPTSDIYRYKFGEIDNINLILISDTCW